MAEDLLADTLEVLYVQAIPNMDAEQPKKLFGEGEKIYCFGFESFRFGFMYGLKAGVGTMDGDDGLEAAA